MVDPITKPTGLVCPECGMSMDGLDFHAHSLTHWPEYLDPARSSKKAIANQKATLSGGVTIAQYIKGKEA